MATRRWSRIQTPTLAGLHHHPGLWLAPDDDRNELAHDRTFGPCAQQSIGFIWLNRPRRWARWRFDTPSEQLARSLTRRSEVRFRGQIGKHLLVLSFSEAQGLGAVCQRRPVDLFAVFVPHPNEAPAILMGASVVT
jgi:hypothetical protein